MGTQITLRLRGTVHYGFGVATAIFDIIICRIPVRESWQERRDVWSCEGWDCPQPASGAGPWRPVPETYKVWEEVRMEPVDPEKRANCIVIKGERFGSAGGADGVNVPWASATIWAANRARERWPASANQPATLHKVDEGAASFDVYDVLPSGPVEKVKLPVGPKHER